MKIGIITHYDVHNHGALLQLYALKKVLENKGNEVSALTFKKNFDFLEADLDKKYDISIKSVFWYLKYIQKIGILRTIFNYRKKRILDKFRKPLIGEYYSRAKDLDKVFIGSDEVFSVEGGVNPFFYGIGVPCDEIYSYAACCGPTTMEEIKEKHMDALMSAGLRKIKKISVRDDNTENIVKALIQAETQIVCDPVILYGYIDEQQKMQRKIKRDYIVIYSYDNNMNESSEVAAIKKIAKENDLLIVSVGFYHKWCDKCVDGSPIDILNYFKYAKFVITDTFHGSVMSLITNTNFATKIRGNKNKLYDLLTRFGVENRIINDFKEIKDILNDDIDYIKINGLIEKNRKSSLCYINSCLEENLNGQY